MTNKNKIEDLKTYQDEELSEFEYQEKQAKIFRKKYEKGEELDSEQKELVMRIETTKIINLLDSFRGF